MADRLIEERIKKVNELRDNHINPYPYTFKRTATAIEILEQNKSLRPEQHAKKKASLAGRVVLLRKMGKATFGHIEDETGRIQFYAKEEDLGDNYFIIRKLDMGDILGIEGDIFATKTGEITIHVRMATMLTKSIRPLPEKHHGLQDTETRYRKRYLDLIANPQVKDTFLKRARIIQAIRTYLDKQGIIEVDTPTLQPIYGGAAAKPFTTQHNTLKMQLYLRISPELYLKRLIVGGIKGVYEIGKNFRNEGIDTNHNPEFTAIEWYVAYMDYNDGMKMTEEMIAQAAKAAQNKTKLNYLNKPIDLTPPFKRQTMAECINEHAKIDVLNMSEQQLRDYCKKENIQTQSFDTWGLLVQHIFEEKCEVHLWQPVFITDHPWETTPLAKVHRTDSRLVERFELYMAGMEISNSYSELNDPQVQKQLLQEQVDRRKKGDDEAQPMDDDFVEAIEYGMPPTSGNGVGIDRLVMILTDSPSIRDVIFFPTMKPQ